MGHATALPATARDVIGAAAVHGLVRATLALREPVGDKLSLFAYRVASMTSETAKPAATAAPARPEVPYPPANR
jgi:hypothetical protein